MIERVNATVKVQKDADGFWLVFGDMAVDVERLVPACGGDRTIVKWAEAQFAEADKVPDLIGQFKAINDSRLTYSELMSRLREINERPVPLFRGSEGVAEAIKDEMGKNRSS